MQSQKSTYCIHEEAVNHFDPVEELSLRGSLGPFAFTMEDSDIQEIKTSLSAVWKNGSYGLLYKSRSTAKSHKCLVDKE